MERLAPSSSKALGRCKPERLFTSRDIYSAKELRPPYNAPEGYEWFRCKEPECERWAYHRTISREGKPLTLPEKCPMHINPLTEDRLSLGKGGRI